MKKKLLTNKSGQVRELKAEDIRAMRAAKDVLPEKILKILPRKRGERGAQKKPKKILMTIRYSSEVISYFKNTGEGWQTRIDSALKKYIKAHPREAKNEPIQKDSKHQKITTHTKKAI